MRCTDVSRAEDKLSTQPLLQGVLHWWRKAVCPTLLSEGMEFLWRKAVGRWGMFTWFLTSRPVFQRQSLVDNSEKHGYHAKHPEKISCELFCAQSPLILQAHTFSGPCALTVMPRFRRKVATLWREIDIKNPGCFLKHIFSINVSFNLIRIW